jgi:hypothetical protein
MKRDTRRTGFGRRLSTLTITAALACFMTFAVSEASATAIAASSPTRAQKLNRALRACKRQPRRKQAACVRLAKKRYGQHHAAAQPPAPALAAPGVPAPTPPPVPAAPSAPLAPAGPTSAWLQQQLVAFAPGHPNLQIVNLNILTRGAPRLGTGVTTQAGGDGVPATTWIFPLLYSYDESYTAERYIGPPLEPFGLPQFETYSQTEHWRTRDNALLDAAGQLVLRAADGSSCVSEPTAGTCPATIGGGA